jgi:hypothetical protein
MNAGMGLQKSSVEMLAAARGKEAEFQNPHEQRVGRRSSAHL